MITKLNGILEDTRPFILLVALIFGFMGALFAAADIVNMFGTRLPWFSEGTAQSHAIVGACLAIVAGRA